MTLIIFFLFISIPGYRTQSSDLQLWRAEGVTSAEVIEEFQFRAHQTDEIWKINNTVDFTISKEEATPWKEFLEDHNVTVKVLDENVTGKIDAKFLQQYEKNITRRVRSASLSFENNTSLVQKVSDKFGDEKAHELEINQSGSIKIPNQIANNFTSSLDNVTKKINIVSSLENATEKLYYTMSLEDVPQYDNFENSSETETRRAKVPPMDLGKQPSFYEIKKFLRAMSHAYPETVALEILGKTLHKNEIYMVKITAKREAPIIMIESGIHGCDWHGIHATLAFMHDLAINFPGQHPTILNKDWYIIPVLNPDGYDYSVKKDRKWRKNTHRFSNCIGVDINRNFAYNWGFRTHGDIKDPCNFDFCGMEPFSEIESQVIQKFVTDNPLYAYIAIHGAGARILSPSRIKGRSPHFKTHGIFTREIAGAMKKAAGHEFIFGPLKKSTGVSTDWTYYVGGVTHSYVINPKGVGLNVTIHKSVKEVRAGLVQLAVMLKVHKWVEGKR